MKKICLGLVLLCAATVAVADILLPPEEEARYKKEYEEALAKCPKDAPLYGGGRCHSCDDPEYISTARYMKCEEICPNRHKIYHYGSSCALK